ncbi:HE65 [Rachiplusia nu nucleopolyhedrovirus]|uniref:HE65 n=1 Tax=Rachiplusia nu nucleopolyhedrovirus TaxID=2605775 RepID=A0AAE6M7H9_9ABAC|nr:HE65 [Rachiplusia nu nucleopolyhedrovirus]QEI03610.1 HE65 [Rachiplusia nu nucleopolyhedrovirus]
MVFIQLDIDILYRSCKLCSNRNRLIITKCSSDKFLNFITNPENELIDQQVKDTYGTYTNIDVYKALMGIYTGKYYYLGVFVREDDVLNQDGTHNIGLYKFIRKLTRSRMNNILNNMIRKVVGSQYNSAEFLLSLMFNLAYIERWLVLKDLPNDLRLPQLFLSANLEATKIYDRLIKCYQEKTSRIDYDVIKFICTWHERLQDCVLKLPILKDDYDLLKTIIMFMLNENDLSMFK